MLFCCDYCVYGIDSEEADSFLSSQEEGFRPLLDVKKFEQYIAKEETKHHNDNTATHTSIPSQHQTATSIKVTARRNDQPSMDSSLCSVTDMSSINTDSGAYKNDAVDSNLSNVVGRKVQASLVLEGTDHDQGLSNSPLKSVLNPGTLQHTNTEVGATTM